MKDFLMKLATTVSSSIFATMPLVIDLDEMVSETDHLLLGQLVDVEMTNEKGEKITDPTARTGQGLTNTIYLIINVEKVYVTVSSEVPETLKIPLDNFLHTSLAEIQDLYKDDKPKYLLLLKGDNFSPIVPGNFHRPIEEKDQILEMIKNK
ncbi:MAG: hypothetical protein WBM99_05645 [Psychromonas sp.]